MFSINQHAVASRRPTARHSIARCPVLGRPVLGRPVLGHSVLRHPVARCFATFLIAVSVILFPRWTQAAGSGLADAIEKQDASAARRLLSDSSVADVNAAQPDGMTALHWATHHDHVDWTRRLIAAGADVSAVNRYGISPLYLACRNGNPAIVQALLAGGADAKTRLGEGETMLMVAARTGNAEVIDALLERGAEIGATGRKGQTALMWAAAEGNVAAVDALVNAGADPETTLPSGFSALFFAAREGHTEVVLRLLDSGLDVNQPMRPKRRAGKGPASGTTPLMLSVINGHFETAMALLDAGAKVTDSEAGYTPLHALTWVRKPIRGDGDPPPQGSGSVTSLEFARALIDRGADVNALHGKHSPPKLRLNRTDATPLLLASETGDTALLKLLLAHGADPIRPNIDRCTPLLAACGVGVISNGDETAGTEDEAIETVTMLLSLGADINATDKFGHSAMHGAAYKSWTKMIPFLIDQGIQASVWNQKNVRGWTPMKIAQGHRPGNFRPSAETIQAIEQALNSSDGDR